MGRVYICICIQKCTVGTDPGRGRGSLISHKKMATERGRIDFMFVPPYPTAGSTTDCTNVFT